MRKRLVAILTTVAVFGVAACSGGGSSSDDDSLKGAISKPTIGPGGMPLVSGVIATVNAMPTQTKTPFSEPNVPNPRVPNDQLMTVIALGDSFGSGEGNPVVGGNYMDIGTLLPGQPKEKWTNSPDVAAQQSAERCHRSDASGAGKAAQQLRSVTPALTVNFVSFACSGAETKNVILPGSWPTPIDVAPTEYEGADPDYTSQPKIKSQLQQAKDWLSTQPSKRADVVYISIGGNDAGFGQVVQDCFITIRFVPPWFRCQDFDSVKKFATPASWNTLTNRLKVLAQQVRSTFGPETLIVFSQYPDLLSIPKTDARDVNKDGICSDQDTPVGPVDWIQNVRTPDAFWIRDVFQKTLNGTIESAIKSLNDSRIVVAKDHVNNQRGFCAAQPIVNFDIVALRNQGRDENLMAFWKANVGTVLSILGAGLGLGNIRLDFSKGGWHPNNAGYELYGQAIYNSIKSYDARVGDYNSVERWRLAPLGPDSIWRTTNTVTYSLTGVPKVTVYWNDRSFNEDYYEIAIKTADGKTRTVSVPAGSTSYEVVEPTIGKSSVSVEVKSCHGHTGTVPTWACSPAVSGTI